MTHCRPRNYIPLHILFQCSVLPSLILFGFCFCMPLLLIIIRRILIQGFLPNLRNILVRLPPPHFVLLLQRSGHVAYSAFNWIYLPLLPWIFLYLCVLSARGLIVPLALHLHSFFKCIHMNASLVFIAPRSHFKYVIGNWVYPAIVCRSSFQLIWSSVCTRRVDRPAIRWLDSVD
jgi:hypothetical protein